MTTTVTVARRLDAFGDPVFEIRVRHGGAGSLYEIPDRDVDALRQALTDLRRPREALRCARCGAMFVPRRAPAAGAPVRFCGDKCRMAHAYATRKAAR